MEPNQDNGNRISRKSFLRICGSVIAGGSILGVTGNLLWKMFTRPDDIFYGVDKKSTTINRSHVNNIVSPYRKVSAFKISDQIDAFDLYEGRLIVAAPNNIYVYEPSGALVSNFPVGSSVRDVTVDDDRVYLLYPTRVEVYDLEGGWIRDWEACSEESDYCSLTVLSGNVFVTDAANKNICMYTIEGGFVKFIQSPSGFIVPSYSFGITNIDGVVYCSNPGRHLVESYSPEGEYISSFGKPGGAAGLFSGCCNPVYLAGTPTGEIITSEKGIPRISCYGKNGEFHSVLLDEKALGGGHAAYEVRVWDDKLVVAGGMARKGEGTEASLFWQIDPNVCTQCGRCETHCVLPVSAVKCIHANKVCGYCDLCGGYYRTNVKELNTAAENMMCPTGAILRKFVEDPYFEYTIDEDLCNGCGKCVKGCSSFGNGSLYLQIKQDLCLNCNECQISTVCASGAITRVPYATAYKLKG